MTDRETYLGDGLYASYAEGQIKLRAPREGGDHEVYLDAQLMGNFLGFTEETFGVKITVENAEKQE